MNSCCFKSADLYGFAVVNTVYPVVLPCPVAYFLCRTHTTTTCRFPLVQPKFKSSQWPILSKAYRTLSRLMSGCSELWVGRDLDYLHFAVTLCRVPSSLSFWASFMWSVLRLRQPRGSFIGRRVGWMAEKTSTASFPDGACGRSQVELRQCWAIRGFSPACLYFFPPGTT